MPKTREELKQDFEDWRIESTKTPNKRLEIVGNFEGLVTVHGGYNALETSEKIQALYTLQCFIDDEKQKIYGNNAPHVNKELVDVFIYDDDFCEKYLPVKLGMDGNKYVCLYGEDMMEGHAVFGDSIKEVVEKMTEYFKTL